MVVNKKKDGTPRYRYLVLGRNSSYIVNKDHKSSSEYTKEDVFNMLEFFINSILVQCGGRVFQQTVGIPMGTNCAPLLADLLFHSYEADFIAELIHRKEHRLARFLDLSFRYIDVALTLYNHSSRDYLYCI